MRAIFRKLYTNFKINEQNRLIIHKPYKTNIDNKESILYNITYEDEKENKLNILHWNNKNCGRDIMNDLINRNN